MFVKFFEEISKRDVQSAGGKGASLGEMMRAGIPVPPGFVVLASAFEEFVSSPIRHPELDSARPAARFDSIESRRESRQGSRIENEQKQTVIAPVRRSFSGGGSERKRSVVIFDDAQNEIASQGLAMTMEEYIDEILKVVNKDDIKSVEQASQEIRGLILKAEIPSKIADEIMEAYRMLMSQPEADQPLADDRADKTDRSDRLGYVAVRSSATAEDSASAAWAGQLESYLNTTQESLLENVKKCWASLFTPRAIFYRLEKFPNSVIARQVGAVKPASSSLGGQSSNQKSKRDNSNIGRSPRFTRDGNFISVAVVVQKMIQSEVSGIAFSVHPVTQDRNQMIIEAGYGLGEAIVSGQITPDNYVIGKSEIRNSKSEMHNSSQPPLTLRGGEKKALSLRVGEGEGELRILNKTISTQEKKLVRSQKSVTLSLSKGHNGVNEWVPVSPLDQNNQKLSDPEIRELSELILKIEHHYGFPVDVEFAREGGKFYVVQSRPITTLQKLESHQKLVFEVEYQREAPISMFYIWYYGHLYAFRELLKLDPIPAEKVFAVYRDGVWEAYTQKDNLNKIKRRIKELDLEDLEKVIDRYLNDYNTFIDNINLITDKSFLERLTGEFVVNFILGDLAEHPLQTKALTAREKTEKLFYSFWEALKERFQWKYFEVHSYDEVLSSTRLDSESIELRKMSLLSARGVTPIKDFQTELKIHLEKNDLEIVGEKGHDDIVGQVAMTGTVTGVVKLIFKKKDIYKIETGDILVTSMTTPDFVPAMKLAGGFITDEGGITSHAAIVAREMRRPCIIGTKIATKVLKDGDLVEVDADNGVVRVLKRAQ